MTAVLLLPKTAVKANPGIPLAVFAGLAVLVPILSQRGQVVALSLAALATVILHLRDRRALWPALRDSRFLRVAVAYVAWCLLSATWALDRQMALVQAGQLLGALLAFTLVLPVVTELTSRERRLVGMGCVGGILIGVLTLAIDGYGGMPLQSLLRHGDPHPPVHMLNKALVTISLMVWPAALHLWQLGRRACAALLLCIVVAVVVPQESSTATLALSVGIVAALLARLTGRFALWAIGLSVVAGALATPYLVEPVRQWFTVHMDLSSWWSAHHRLYIWSFVLERMSERPWLGWGLEASRAMPDFGWAIWPGQDRMIPLHPHNEFLQVWLELGPFGLALILIALIVPLRVAMSYSWGQRMFVAGAWAATTAAMVPGYGAGQTWWLFTVMGLALLYRAVLIPEEDDA